MCQVILGFSITAYLTVVLLLFHYVFVYDPRRIGTRGQEYINPVDRGNLTFIRDRVVSWTPTVSTEVIFTHAPVDLA
jgi:hypothetical protein